MIEISRGRIAVILALILACTIPASAAELHGTSWRLVEIVSMDDSVDAPDDSSKYTLAFGDDGSALLVADCNRGSGSWTSEADNRLRFGPIASTQALCPPGSISKKYLEQFEWVRSYVMEDSHLFLATMADGSIIEFEPTDNVAALVFDDEIRTSSATQMQEAILSRLFDHYASERGIDAKPEEIDAFVENMVRGMAKEGLTAEDDLKPEEAEELATMRRNMARALILQWKINKTLYDEYGGRIIYQQLGPEPLDAYREFLEQRQSEGIFSIQDKSLAESFWRYFTDESIHDFMEKGSNDEVRAFTIQPWADR